MFSKYSQSKPPKIQSKFQKSDLKKKLALKARKFSEPMPIDQVEYETPNKSDDPDQNSLNCES
jgi:hypothetical protein